MASSSSLLKTVLIQTQNRARIFKNKTDLSIFNRCLSRGFELRIGLVALDEPYLSLCIEHFFDAEFKTYYAEIASTLADSRLIDQTIVAIKKEFLQYITFLTAENIQKLLQTEIHATKKYHTNVSFRSQLKTYFNRGVIAIGDLKHADIPSAVIRNLDRKLRRSWNEIQANSWAQISRREYYSEIIFTFKDSITPKYVLYLVSIIVLSVVFIRACLKYFLPEEVAKPVIIGLDLGNKLAFTFVVSMFTMVTLGYAIFKLNEKHKFIYQDEYSAVSLLDNLCRRQFNQNQAARAQFPILSAVLPPIETIIKSQLPESKDEVDLPKSLKRKNALTILSPVSVKSSIPSYKSGESVVKKIGSTTLIDIKEGYAGGAVVILNEHRHAKLIDPAETANMATIIARNPKILPENSSQQGIKRNGKAFFFRTRGQGAEGALAIQFRVRELSATEQAELGTMRTRAFSPVGRSSK